MASTATLYTTGLMAKGSASVSTGGSSSGHGINNAFDFNPDTYWAPSSTDNQIIDVDMGASVSPDNFAIWVHDYDTDYESGTQSIGIYTDDNDNGSYSAVTVWGGSAVLFDNTVGDPIYYPLSSLTLEAVTKRYWRIAIASMTSIAEISMFLWLKTRSISIANQWPEDDTDDFETDTVTAGGGRQYIQLFNRNATGRITRRYFFNGDTDKDALRNAFLDSKKNAYPLILKEGAVSKLVRFTNDPFNKRQVQYQQYTPTVSFDRIPYIEDGETY